MIPAVAGAVGFGIALAAWRWGLASRNWLEGGLVGLTAGVLVGIVARFVLRVLEARAGG